MDCSFKLLENKFKHRRVHWSRLQLSILRHYFRNISKTCDIGQLPCAVLLNHFESLGMRSSPELIVILATKAASFTEVTRHVFMVPRLTTKFHESQNHGIKKHQLVEVFISFLLRLLRHKTDLIGNPYKDRFNNLEKELRLLHTILVDISLMLCDDEHEQVHNLLEEFEVVANEAGSLLHSLLFPIDRATFKKVRKGLGVVLNHIDLLKANIMKFLYLWPSITISTYITPKTSAVNSFVIVNSLIYDLEDLMNRDDNSIAGVQDQIKTLHQGLTILRSSIKDVRSPQPSKIGELKEYLMRIGDMAHQAEYLIISFLVGDIPLWYLISRLTDINYKIQLIGTDVLEIIKRYKTGGTAQLPLQAKRNLEVDNITVGFEDKVIHILDQLVGRTENLQVISIFGMPGLGKTTLVKKLYNNSSVNYWFDKLSWCVVSQTYQRKSIMTDILIDIATELEKVRIMEMEEESLVEHIYKTLKGRRYLIVMDDIWDSNVWDDMWRCFPDDRNGSRILFTTRNKDVAPPKSIIYAQPPLSDDQCWELLEKKVFNNKPVPPELIGIGKKIAANCCGLPLVVVVIAGVLSTMDKEKSTWEEVEGNLASYIFYDGDDTVMQILELSYKHLPEYLKPCFLYFGAFSEDKETLVRNLTRLWIAEGFIHKEAGKSAENVAEKYLMELIDKSLVIVTQRRSDGGVKTCAVHDLLRDLCLKRSKEENFLKFVDDNIYSVNKKGHRLAALEECASSSYYLYVRSFHDINCLISPMSYVRDSRYLRVGHCNSLETPFVGTEYLVYLRYLVISDLPPSIGSLVNLEYLLVEGYKTVHLSASILKMKRLRYIHVDSEAIYGKDCKNTQKNNLEFLSGVLIREGTKDEKMLKCSPLLRKLELRACQPVDLSFLALLESLKIDAYGLKMEKIGFPSNIRKLALSRWRLCSEEISVIGRLENLEVLKLKTSSVARDRWDTRDGEFQKLTFLKLDIANFSQWNVASSQHFPKFQRLVLSNCCDLEEIPSEIGEVATLQLIEVKKQCRKSLEESAKRIQQQQWDMGNEELKVIVNTYVCETVSDWLASCWSDLISSSLVRHG